MTGRHRRTLEAVFADPVAANIAWSDVEALFLAAGATVSAGRGSRMRVSLNGIAAVSHRPHPRRETDRGAVRQPEGSCVRQELRHDHDDA
jgi:HicA-like toxin of HicAB toxin-antitoxin system